MKVLLSIHPKYVEKIFSGEKKYEYRKNIFKKEVESILIYCTSPISKIVGEIFFDKIFVDSPSEIWKITKEYSGITSEDYESYYENKNLAYAIKINELKIYEEPISLPSHIKAPQSYRYIT